MNETKPKPKWQKWGKRIFIVGVLSFLLIVVTLALWNPFRPNPEITKLTARETARPGDLFVVIVDVSIKNNGANGTIKVIAVSKSSIFALVAITFRSFMASIELNLLGSLS